MLWGSTQDPKSDLYWQMKLTDAQWELVADLFEEHSPKDKQGRGRPPRQAREVVNGVLWVLKTGAQWNEMPSKYPSSTTCFRYFKRWEAAGVMSKALERFADALVDCGEIDLDEGYIDGTFSSAKKGVPKSAKRSAVRARRSWRSRIGPVFLSD